MPAYRAQCSDPGISQAHAQIEIVVYDLFFFFQLVRSNTNIQQIHKCLGGYGKNVEVEERWTQVVIWKVKVPSVIGGFISLNHT